MISLARGLFLAGGREADSAAWAHDDFVHAWWVQPGRLLAGEYPGHASPARARHKVDLLVDAGIRTFVDLTTPADRLEPYEPLIAEVGSARGLDVRHVSFRYRTSVSSTTIGTTTCVKRSRGVSGEVLCTSVAEVESEGPARSSAESSPTNG